MCVFHTKKRFLQKRQKKTTNVYFIEIFFFYKYFKRFFMFYINNESGVNNPTKNWNEPKQLKRSR
jgi:hypothetical protein